ncbi:hypothetical protein JCM19233_6859 [Vibrio astriarenae]|nr:hypothetical protein JCM19233_6859 [Vibrio sp. C7]
MPSFATATKIQNEVLIMTTKYQNAVLDDKALIEGLKSINPSWVI